MKSLGECIYSETLTNPDGEEYFEFSCVDPFLQKTYSWWETNMTVDNPVMTLAWKSNQIMRNTPIIPIIMIAIYGILVVSGRKYFSDRAAWNLRYPLAAWNLSLSVFSIVGAFRLGPQVLYLMNTIPLRDNFCGDVIYYYGRGSGGFWIQMFILSKFPELLDTFFIIVHKKPLIFLHWYHHVTVLLYSWSAYALPIPASPIFAAMNFCVHSIMYGYYFLMAMRIKPKWFSAIYITIAQIVQMVVGVLVTSFNFYYFFTDTEGTCNLGYLALLAGFSMYGSYLFLFLQFFMGRYQFVGSEKDGKQKFF